MKPVILFKKTSGLHETVRANRLMMDPTTGETELVTGYNIKIGNTGEISRRAGLTATARTEDIHSLFCDGGNCMFVWLQGLYVLNPDFSAYGVYGPMTLGAKVSYCQVADRTYYANGYEKGYVIDKTHYTWVSDEYVGPTTFRQYSDPPVGNLLTHISSRIYVAKGTVLWYSEPFAYGWFNLAKNFIDFGQDILMLRAVNDGIFVGLERCVVFLRGKTPSEFVYNVISEYPPVKGTDVYASEMEVNKGNMFGAETTDRSVIWAACDGIYVGQSDGKVTNVTKNKFRFTAASGCAVYCNGEYIVNFD